MSFILFCYDLQFLIIDYNLIIWLLTNLFLIIHIICQEIPHQWTHPSLLLLSKIKPILKLKLIEFNLTIRKTNQLLLIIQTLIKFIMKISIILKLGHKSEIKFKISIFLNIIIESLLIILIRLKIHFLHQVLYRIIQISIYLKI